MKFVARMFGTMAVASLLAFPLRADDTPTPGSTAKKVDSVRSRHAHRALAKAKPADATSEPARLMSGPSTRGVGSSAMGSPESPASDGQSTRGDVITPKIELFLGYSFIRATPRSTRDRFAWLHGGDANIAFNVNQYLGLVADFGGYPASSLTITGAGTPASRVVDADGRVFTYMIGPRLSYRNPRITPFAQALFGVAHAGAVSISGCTGSSVCIPLPSENAFAMVVGGGFDANLHHWLAIRLIQADYFRTQFKDPSSPTGPSGQRNNVRLSTGLVFRFGGNPLPVPPSAACSVQPAEVFAGEPVTATAGGSNFNPKRTVKYDWDGTGVKVAGSDASTTIDTTGLQPGSYGVTANLNDGSKKNGFASCSARFTVKEPHPPVISCSAAPASVRTGETSTINSNASSPDGRRLTYGYTTNAGEISGNGDTATLNTQGAQPGHITVTCNVSDDRNPPLTGSSTTIVAVEAPPPPPAPAPEIKQLEAKLALHSIYFPTARPSAENPEAGLVDSQAQILKTLAEDFKSYLKYEPNAHLILGGHADPRGSAEYNKALTQRRVERTKNFLVEHGVPADHFETRSFGKEDQLTADQIKELIAQNPDLSPADRQQMLKNLQVLVLANNRRVDVTLSTTGQQSTRLYPFNAKDYLALINPKGGEKKPPVKKKPKR
jgi:outer membrane protein OmpA-like peptidoglycan-associated protein